MVRGLQSVLPWQVLGRASGVTLTVMNAPLTAVNAALTTMNGALAAANAALTAGMVLALSALSVRFGLVGWSLRSSLPCPLVSWRARAARTLVARVR